MAGNQPLRLSYDNGLLAGVCGGIAEWLGWKPAAVRVLFVLLSIASAAFPGVLAYGLLYFAMPGPERPRKAILDNR
ncbi:MAG: PspC domain-containing protein [Planctomycetia bacterium]|nr:PspC domain-containing protein [Planctomycetia bacterium]